jgi:hypothetical protein
MNMFIVLTNLKNQYINPILTTKETIKTTLITITNLLFCKLYKTKNIIKPFLKKSAIQKKRGYLKYLR